MSLWLAFFGLPVKEGCANYLIGKPTAALVEDIRRLEAKSLEHALEPDKVRLHENMVEELRRRMNEIR